LCVAVDYTRSLGLAPSSCVLLHARSVSSVVVEAVCNLAEHVLCVVISPDVHPKLLELDSVLLLPSRLFVCVRVCKKDVTPNIVIS
jgi:hypothetical protein